MNDTSIIEKHTNEEVMMFANKMDIPFEKALFIESMRGRYICFEHDYVKNPDDIDTTKE